MKALNEIIEEQAEINDKKPTEQPVAMA